MLVYYCPDLTGPHGTIAPGLLFGSLDFDNREVNIGEQVYRIWVNPVVGAPYNNQDHLLIGRATSAAGGATTITGNTQNYGYQHALAYNDNTCTNKGGSGSPGISESWNRILEGPLSDGGPEPNLACTSGTKSFKANAIFTEMYLDPRWPGQLNSSAIQLLGLQPQRYWGYQDRDHNEVMDLQEDFQVMQGEKDRSYFFYNFDSAQQNSLWRTFGLTNIFKNQVTPPGPPYGIVHLQTDTNATPVSTEGGGEYSETLLRLDSFPLQASTTYRVNMKLQVFNASGPTALQFVAGSSNPQVVSILTAAGTTTRPSFIFTTPAQTCNLVTTPGACGIRFQAVNPSHSLVQPLLSADLSVLSISKETARDVMIDFDTHDSRGSWRNMNTGTRALILPDGVGSTPNQPPDFAAAITDDPGRGIGSDWPIMNEHLDLTQGGSYTVFFKVKNSSAVGSITGDAEVFVGGTGTILAQTTGWSATGTWSGEIGVGPFTAQNDTRLRFGPRSFSGNPNGHILLDNIRIHRN